MIFFCRTLLGHIEKYGKNITLSMLKDESQTDPDLQEIKGIKRKASDRVNKVSSFHCCNGVSSFCISVFCTPQTHLR